MPVLQTTMAILHFLTNGMVVPKLINEENAMWQDNIVLED
jgi:hypothetical protein